MLKIIPFLLIPFYAEAWYPARDSQEVRVIFSNPDIRDYDNFDKWKVEGQLIGTQLRGDFLVTGLFKLDKEQSAIGAAISKQVNDLVWITLQGHLNQETNLGGSFWVSAEFDTGSISLLPFILVDHERVGAVGVISYFDIKKTSFHLGVSLEAPIERSAAIGIVFIFGSSFKSGEEYDLVL